MIAPRRPLGLAYGDCLDLDELIGVTQERHAQQGAGRSAEARGDDVPDTDEVRAVPRYGKTVVFNKDSGPIPRRASAASRFSIVRSA
ncbi:MAG TPA: hypothetical protein VMD09_11905 [Solirubrobacteraceae bacterium]|nr:hypothetical protein [Solirubrobacteraceae bacterium]